MLWAGRSGVRITAEKKRLFSKMSRLTLGSTWLPRNRYQGFLPWEKWPECEVDHSPPSSADVKWVELTSTPLHTFVTWTGTSEPSPLPRGTEVDIALGQVPLWELQFPLQTAIRPTFHTALLPGTHTVGFTEQKVVVSFPALAVCVWATLGQTKGGFYQISCNQWSCQ
jgi:hypothetical protein